VREAIRSMEAVQLWGTDQSLRNPCPFLGRVSQSLPRAEMRSMNSLRAPARHLSYRPLADQTQDHPCMALHGHYGHALSLSVAERGVRGEAIFAHLCAFGASLRTLINTARMAMLQMSGIAVEVCLTSGT
jgi:hypothetical protein